MKKIFTLLTAIAVTCSTLNAQIVLDGNISETVWGSALATSSGGPTPGFGAGHETNAIYATSNGTNNIYIGLAGNVQDGNKILIFLDTKTGGYNNCNFGRTSAPAGLNNINSGITFDAGFSPDYCLVIGTNTGQTNYFFDLYTLSGTSGSGGGPNSYLGDQAVMGASPLNSSTTRGFEVVIPKSSLGYTNGTNMKMMAMYIGTSGFLSNQFLTKANSGEGNYGSGAVDFTANAPNPVTALSSVLVIEMPSFTIKKKANSVDLLWLTASEKDNALFQIERSANATDFSPIGEVKGAGNSTAVKNYTFTDVSPLSGVNYYRLKTVDYYGAVMLSKVVSVNFSSKNDTKVAVYPNPTRDVLRVDMNATDASTMTVQISDLMGRVVLSQNVSVNKGANFLPFNVSSLPSGAYFVKVNGNVTRFVKQ